MSLLNDPNCSSPANVDAGVLYRTNKAEYERIVKDQVASSQKHIPEDMVLPREGIHALYLAWYYSIEQSSTASDLVFKKPVEEDIDDDAFWYDDDDEEEEDDDEDEGDDDWVFMLFREF